ncbi:MAG: XRE family transcriptional regulator [Bacteroidaceae bacterium]|nr:XRE family transcriptional regulator [Bacteroidaceae bacterium]MBQ8889203.1 XRE family transcriptional regulator [Bacteroidaceae bacterium]
MENIGTLIKEELKNQDRTASWLAAKLSCNRANVYNIFSRENIDIQLLIRISKILKRNFFKAIYEEIEDNINNV